MRSDKEPSFHVNRDKGFFHCFGCGVGGDVTEFLERIRTLSIPPVEAERKNVLDLLGDVTTARQNLDARIDRVKNAMLDTLNAEFGTEVVREVFHREYDESTSDRG